MHVHNVQYIYILKINPAVRGQNCTNLFLYFSHSRFMLFWCRIEPEDNLVPYIHKDIVDYRDWKQENADEQPSVINDDILQAFVAHPYYRQQERSYYSITDKWKLHCQFVPPFLVFS